MTAGLSSQLLYMVHHEAWEPKGHRPTEQLTFQERTRRILIEHALSIAPDLGGMVERGEGREIIGTVEGREDEDLEVLIDKRAQEKTEESFRVLGEKYGMSFFVFSEHHNFMVGQGEPEFFAALDPTENSDEYAVTKLLPPVIDSLQKVVEEKIDALGSADKQVV